jgi:hypothetical protein
MSCNKSRDNTRHGAFMFMKYMHTHPHTHTNGHTHTHTSTPSFCTEAPPPPSRPSLQVLSKKRKKVGKGCQKNGKGSVTTIFLQVYIRIYTRKGGLTSISYLYLYRPYILVRYWVALDMVLVSLMARVRFLVPKCCFISGLLLQWVPGIFLFLMRQLLNARNHCTRITVYLVSISVYCDQRKHPLHHFTIGIQKQGICADSLFLDSNGKMV